MSKSVKKRSLKINKMQNKNNTLYIALGVIALIAIIGIALRFFSNAGTATNFNPVNKLS